MSPQQKQVTFGDLTITEFPIIMGYNPACQGCPITIGWEPMGTHTRNLELYEYTRGPNRVSRRKLVIPVQKRSQMLLDAGYTQEQIIKRALQVAEIKNEREESIKDGDVQGFGKFSKSFKATFAKLNISNGPKKTTVIARSA
mmetsp:Transcript_6075/g.14716  ORF Transcript_6075/g.14716 Transcript_6075/m.14716 type:complete len:142 (+) Transcript_6075:118-543(+)|eukprot:CAMPEP_0116104716 /NCGR_PEP_ID=MMETSP0327-20121206/14615_1 /TAXON_ID=44447 /ORGANISM="Pseudo-nitzschia delicatissima, Strain B596" /LENGTH=141 /DNA_ID=CAMNT_0003597009 /DNA_START=82 /DNA_END=507 /DNA_ORIENTATION=+